MLAKRVDDGRNEAEKGAKSTRFVMVLFSVLNTIWSRFVLEARHSGVEFPVLVCISGALTHPDLMAI